MSKLVSVSLFGRDGVTRQASFGLADNVSWTDELKGEGSFTFTYFDSPSIDENRIGEIVKFSYGDSSDDYVFAGVIEKIARNQTDEVGKVTISGRGARVLLENALIYKDGAGTTRKYTDAYVGAIMKELVEEAQARGTLTEISLTFDETEDSNGDPWTVDEELTIEESVGTNLAEVASRHADAAVDVWVNADLELNYAIERGTDTTLLDNAVVLRPAQNTVNLNQEINGPVRNVIYTEYGNGTFVETAGSTTGTYGRRETFLSLRNVDSGVTAQSITDRTLPTLETPADGMTIEVVPEGWEPYIDYNVGDYVWVDDRFGNRYKYRVRAITINVSGEIVRVIPELGTQRAQLEERLRRLIQRQEAKTAAGEASASASAPDYATVGAEVGALTYDGEVLTYDPLTGEGTADIPSLDDDPVDFINATGLYLGVGDDIVLVSLEGEDYAAVGIRQRAGAITPVAQPIGTLDPDFPLRTDTLPNQFNVIKSSTPGFTRISVDYENYLGQGSDTILGQSQPKTGNAGSSIMGYSRNLTTSFDLGVAPGASVESDYVVFSDGRLITFDEDGVYERDPSTGVWTTHDFNGIGVKDVVWDETNRWIWIYTAGASAPSGGPFWSFTVNDAAPVARGVLASGLSNTTFDATVRLTSNNGILALQYDDAETTGYRYYVKASNDGNDFDWDHITTNFIVPVSDYRGRRGLSVPKDNGLYFLTTYTASTPDEIAINFYDNTDGTITTYLTGIEQEGNRTVRGYHISTAGLHVFTCVRDDGGTDRLSLATNNLITTQYVYTYTDYAVLSEDNVGAPVEVQPNVYYFGVGDILGSSSGGLPQYSTFAIGVTLT